MPLPEPLPGEVLSDFLDRCIPRILETGDAEDDDQAEAICYTQWEDRSAGDRRARRAMEIEIRSFDVREMDVGDEENDRLIRGRAAVFSVESDDLGGFVEIIEPGFFDEVLDGDVRSLWNHNADYVLGRTVSGTLRVFVDDRGLGFEADAPETTWADDALVSLRRGDVTRASFGFRVKEHGDKWEKRADGTVVRTLLPGGCERLFDVSPVTFPAYQETSVEARSIAREMSESHPPGQEPGGGEGGEDKARARARLDLRRRLLDLAEATIPAFEEDEDA